MCPVKTENLSRNVPREEGKFWRELVRTMNVKSRGHLENFLLLEGLKAINRSAARKLAKLRAEVQPRTFQTASLAAVLLGIFVGGMVMQGHSHLARVARAHVVNTGWRLEEI